MEKHDNYIIQYINKTLFNRYKPCPSVMPLSVFKNNPEHMNIKYLPIAMSLLSLVGCDDTRDANAGNMAQAVSEYLSATAGLCLQQSEWPVDIGVMALKLQKEFPRSLAGKMAALESTGLVAGTWVSHSEKNSTPGTSADPELKRYTLTPLAKKYLIKTRFAATDLSGQRHIIVADRLCWGKQTLDKIISWTPPKTSGLKTETVITYTYDIADEAPWALTPQVNKAFQMLSMINKGKKKAKKEVHAHLTARGWIIDTPEYK